MEDDKPDPAIDNVEEEGIENERMIKYERVGGFLGSLFLEDSLSCMALHQCFICVGTYSGAVVVLDLHGNFISRIYTHFKKVNQISIDYSGQYVASCSEDGTVAINAVVSAGIKNQSSTTHQTIFNSSKDTNITSSIASSNYPPQSQQVHNYYSAVYSCQLEEMYAIKRERIFVSGGISGQLFLNKKGWILNKESILHEGEGPIHSLKWRNNLLAWANDLGVKVYDVENDQRVTYVERPSNCPPLELCCCHLVWIDDENLAIGWGNTIRIVQVRKTNQNFTEDVPGSNIGAPERFGGSSGKLYALVISRVTLDFFISGMSLWYNCFDFGSGKSKLANQNEKNVNDEDKKNSTFYEKFAVLGFRPPGEGPVFQENTTKNSPTNEKSGNNKEIIGEGSELEDTPFPELHIMTHNGAKDLTADALPLNGYEGLRACDYQLVCEIVKTVDGQLKSVLYIATPKDMIVARPRDVDDHIDLALSNKNYELAVEISRKFPNELDRYALNDVVGYFLSHLLQTDQDEEAALMCSKLLDESNPAIWEKYVFVFAQKGKLSAIAPYVPTTSPRLNTQIYEMVLKHFLENDALQLLETIRKWPKPRIDDKYKNLENFAAPEYTETNSVFDPLYDPVEWINLLEDVLRRHRTIQQQQSSHNLDDQLSLETSYFMEALAELYSATKQYDHSLRIYLSQGSFCSNKDHVFQLIVEHGLWNSVEDKVVKLLEIHPKTALTMLVNQTDHFEIESVAHQLNNHREFLHEYLHNIFLYRLVEYNMEKFAHFHELQVSLYAEFAPTLLLNFLKMSNFVPLEKAKKYCSDHDPPMYEGLIFILGRMGQHKDALDLILNQLEDIPQAIRFVQKEDLNLWDYLIDLSISRKEFVEELLKCACSHQFDPLKIVRKIPLDMNIPKLKKYLLNIISNYQIQLKLCEGCYRVFEIDQYDLLRKVICGRKAAIHVQGDQNCEICLNGIAKPSNSYSQLNPLAPIRTNVHFHKESNRLIAFHCGHLFHLACLEEKTRTWKKTVAYEQVDGNEMEYKCFVCDDSSRIYMTKEEERNTKQFLQEQRIRRKVPPQLSKESIRLAREALENSRTTTEEELLKLFHQE